ncbi:hypothetical protein A2U01_0000587, partial [Trifolium medium]|nr:hypothetical protein [Trifolium medium]
VSMYAFEEECKPWFAPLWWRDICSIGSNLNHNWFLQGVVKKLGNGLHTSFWRDTWVGEVPLWDCFPRLFSISSQKEASVAEVRSSHNGIVGWRLDWRRMFFEWEQVLFNDLLEIINPVSISEEEDRWGWLPERGAVFSFYSKINISDGLFSVCPGDFGSTVACFYFTSIWKCPAP